MSSKNFTHPYVIALMNSTGLLTNFKQLFYPPTCMACQRTLHKQEEVLCLHCKHSLMSSSNTSSEVYQRFWGRVHIENIFHLMSYERGNTVQQLMKQFKYRSYTQIGDYLGKELARKIKQPNSSIDLIVPVPLHSNKLRKRGFNQSDVLSNALARELQITMLPNLLQRKVDSSTQTRKSRITRWNNVKDIFEVNDSSQVIDKSILLIDDILTTGATLEAAAQELYIHGAKSVSIGVAAVADH